MDNKLKLLIFALDGASPQVIEQHRKELPHLHGLMKEGAWGRVAGPPFSYDRWFSYYTGLRPEQHGIEALRVSSAGRITLADARVEKFLWDYVGQAGLRFGMLGGIGCEPPAQTAGFWVNFYFDVFHPAEAGQCCTNLWLPVFPYPVCREMEKTAWPEVKAEAVIETLTRYNWRVLVDWVAQRQQRERKMLAEMTARWPVDVLWYYAFELDWSQHLAAHRPDTVTACYRVLDETLGWLQAKYRPELTLVISDHGVAPLGTDIPYPGLKPLPGLGACLPLEDRHTVWTGEHHAESFYALSGLGVRPDGRVDRDFLQIFPRILDSLGIVPPDDLPGRPLAGQPSVPGERQKTELWQVRAPLYNQLQWVAREDLLAFMISHCGATGQDRVLDVGTGTGTVANALAPYVRTVLGVDKEPAMLAQAKPTHSNVEFREMDIEQLAVPDGSIDLVTARMVLHHVANLECAFREVRRVLSARGRFVICEGVPPSEAVIGRYKEIFRLKEPERHIFTAELLCRLLQDMGFVDISHDTFIVPQVSLRNWLSASGLTPEVCAQIAGLHRTANEEFWKIYNMKEIDNDLLMDWKFVVATGMRA